MSSSVFSVPVVFCSAGGRVLSGSTAAGALLSKLRRLEWGVARLPPGLWHKLEQVRELEPVEWRCPTLGDLYCARCEASAGYLVFLAELQGHDFRSGSDFALAALDATRAVEAVVRTTVGMLAREHSVEARCQLECIKRQSERAMRALGSLMEPGIPQSSQEEHVVLEDALAPVLSLVRPAYSSQGHRISLNFCHCARSVIVNPVGLERFLTALMLSVSHANQGFPLQVELDITRRPSGKPVNSCYNALEVRASFAANEEPNGATWATAPQQADVQLLARETGLKNCPIFVDSGKSYTCYRLALRYVDDTLPRQT